MATIAQNTRSTTVNVGSTTAGPFNVGFRLLEDDDLKVYIDNVETVAYTVTSAYVDGYDDSAQITLTSTVGAGTVIRIEGHRVPERQADYLPGDAELTKKMNIEQAQQEATLAELRRDIDRTPRILGAAQDALLPETSKLLGVDATGQFSWYEFTGGSSGGGESGATIYASPAALIAATEGARGTGSTWQVSGRQGTYGFTEVTSGQDFTTPGGVKLQRPVDTNLPYFISKADAEAYRGYVVAPDAIYLAGMGTANEFQQAARYRVVVSEPTHAGKVTLTLAGGTTAFYEPDPLAQMVTPKMYGGGITGVKDALQNGRSVDLGKDQTYTGAVTYRITNTKLFVTGENITFNATGRTTGTQGAFFWFSDAEVLHWDVKCTFALENKYSGGPVVRAESATSAISLKRTTVRNPNYNTAGSAADDEGTGALWNAIGIGVEGYYTASTPLQYASLHVEDCHVIDVIRAQASGVCFGFYLGQAARTRFYDCTVDGVFLGTTANTAASGYFDADGVVYFTEATTSGIDGTKIAYKTGDFIMRNCTIKNCQGRWVKTKQCGYELITQNRFVIDRATDSGLFYLIQGNPGGGNAAVWHGIDEQENPGFVDDNEFLFDTEIVNQQGAMLISQRAGLSTTAPLTTDLMRVHGSFRRNNIRMINGGTTAARSLTSIVFFDITGMIASTNGRYVLVEYSGNVATNGNGYSAVAVANRVAGAFWYPSIGTFNTLNAEIRCIVNGNNVDTWELSEVSDWGGTGTHTNYLYVEIVGNRVNNTTVSDALDTSGGITTLRLYERDNVDLAGTGI